MSESIPEITEDAFFDKDTFVLRALDAGHDLSQRDLARQTGISLGAVNYCLKALAGPAGTGEGRAPDLRRLTIPKRYTTGIYLRSGARGRNGETSHGAWIGVHDEQDPGRSVPENDAPA